MTHVFWEYLEVKSTSDSRVELIENQSSVNWNNSVIIVLCRWCYEKLFRGFLFRGGEDEKIELKTEKNNPQFFPSQKAEEKREKCSLLLISFDLIHIFAIFTYLSHFSHAFLLLYSLLIEQLVIVHYLLTVIFGGSFSAHGCNVQHIHQSAHCILFLYSYLS